MTTGLGGERANREKESELPKQERLQLRKIVSPTEQPNHDGQWVPWPSAFVTVRLTSLRVTAGRCSILGINCLQEGKPLMFHLIWSVILGFFAGLIARAVLPGSQHMGIIATTAVGILGSLIGGVIGHLIKRPEPGAKFHPAGFVMSIVGAIVFLLCLRFIG